MRTRVALAVVGIALGLFGVFRLLTQIDVSDLEQLLIWLVAAVIIHDGILSPVIVGVGALIRKVIPPRARASLQGALIAGSLVTVIALPLIHRAYSQPDSKAILQQDFTANLGILLAVVAGAAVLFYVATVLRDRHRYRTRPLPGNGSAGSAGGSGADADPVSER